MKRIAPGALAGLAVTLALAPPALAAPANVTVRIEGDASTLVPRTTLTTTEAPAGKDGDTCSGTSAMGAMHAATAGDWAGTYFGAGGWFVETIKGETHASLQAGYWGLWINHEFANLGLCDTELQTGDDVLLTPNNGPILELAGVPANTAPGQPVAVTVREHAIADPDVYPTTTVATPAEGATVTYGGATATTGADGVATLTFAGAGPATVQATEAGRTRSAALTTCVSTGADGACGSQIPLGEVPPPTATEDTTAPVASLSGLPRGKVFSRRKAPRELAGSVTADPSGLKSVRLSIARKLGDRCWTFDGGSERFERHRCGGSSSFRIGDRAEWSYLLPKRLPKGRYTIKAVAIDKLGNSSATETVIRVR